MLNFIESSKQSSKDVEELRSTLEERIQTEHDTTHKELGKHSKNEMYKNILKYSFENKPFVMLHCE